MSARIAFYKDLNEDKEKAELAARGEYNFDHPGEICKHMYSELYFLYLIMWLVKAR